MKTQDQAAALIQARWKGRAYRKKLDIYVGAITRLQALQRGRFVRANFAKYRDFVIQQRTFERESKQRRERIWQHQQQLLYMESISPEQYEKLINLKRRRAAKAIQLRWKEYKEYSKQTAHEESTDEEDDNLEAWQNLSNASSTLNIPDLQETKVDQERFLETKNNLQQQIRRRMQDMAKKIPWKHELPSNATKEDKAQARRIAFERLQLEKEKVKTKLHYHRKKFRGNAGDRELEKQASLARCDGLIQALLQPPPFESILPEVPTLKDYDAALSKHPLPKSKKRRSEALRSHESIMKSLQVNHPWEMPVAGKIHDMRLSPHTWPWSGSDRVWSWPKEFHCDLPTSPSDISEPDAISIFLQTQSSDAEELPWLQFSQKYYNDDQILACSVANPSLYSYPKRELSASGVNAFESLKDVYGDEFASSVHSDAKDIVTQISVQMQFNTQMRLKVAEAAPKPGETSSNTIDYAQLRRNNMACRIQAHYRGHCGRKIAKEMRAIYFVNVHGRAIRRGLCEECGDERAVLECKECTESTHFCPQCWVQVHSTRRRKTHAALPMVVAPIPIAESAVAHTSAEPIDACQMPLKRDTSMPKKISPQVEPSTTISRIPDQLCDSNSLNSTASGGIHIPCEVGDAQSPHVTLQSEEISTATRPATKPWKKKSRAASLNTPTSTEAAVAIADEKASTSTQATDENPNLNASENLSPATSSQALSTSAIVVETSSSAPITEEPTSTNPTITTQESSPFTTTNPSQSKAKTPMQKPWKKKSKSSNFSVELHVKADKPISSENSNTTQVHSAVETAQVATSDAASTSQ